MANLLKVVILCQFVSGTSWFEPTACSPIDISMPTTVSDMTKFPNIVRSRYNGCSFSGGIWKYGILNINCCIIWIKFLPKGPINTLRPRQNGRYFPDDLFKGIFLNENARLSIKISLKLIGMKLMRKSNISSRINNKPEDQCCLGSTCSILLYSAHLIAIK